MGTYSIGIDFGTVDITNGEEIGVGVWAYAHGEDGIVLDGRDPNLARQHPLDYIEGTRISVRAALEAAGRAPGFAADDVVGIGVDTTGSTPLPVDTEGTPLAMHEDFKDHPAALAWLWKDHTAFAEAAEITDRARTEHPEYLAKCGGVYSSEWYWSKLLQACRTAPEVFSAAATWVEMADWIPAFLTGTAHPARLKRCICAAGHKAMFHTSWGGYPDADFLGALHPELKRIRQSLPDEDVNIGQSVGGLSAEWAGQLGLPEGIPVAAGAFDAHLGAVGAGIREGTLVKIIGTSSCDLAVAPLAAALPDIPGLCGIVPESVLPGYYGLEAGQSAVGDIFNWFVNRIQPGGVEAGSHEALTRDAEQLRPGESGLLALDWNNGNRTVLVDQRLTGLMLGMTLHTSPAEMYRALIEATAFGARVIIERFEEYGIAIDEVVNCGGISVKNPMVMQIYADVFNRPLKIARGTQTCALGAAMAGAVVAGAYPDFSRAAERMTGVLDKVFLPDEKAAGIYDRLYDLYKAIHDLFGRGGIESDTSRIMKDLLAIRDEVRGP